MLEMGHGKKHEGYNRTRKVYKKIWSEENKIFLGKH